MRVDERYLRYALASAFALGGIWAFLVRGEAWPFEMEDLRLGPHATVIAHEQLEAAISQEDYDLSLIEELSRRISVMDPLSATPFEAMLAVQLESERVDSEVAGDLARAALKREARNLSARLFLVDQAVLDQRWDEAFAAFGKAYQLWPSESVELREMMYESLDDETWSAAFIARLDGTTGWEKTFVQQLPVEVVDIETAVALYRPFPELHGQLLSKLQRQSGLEAARIAWSELRPQEAALDEYGRIDFGFVGLDALSPFNWGVDRNFAEFEQVEGGGLRLSYRGRQRPRMASQTLYLPPGDFRFESHLSNRPSDPAGDIVWELACIGSREKLLSVSIFDTTLVEAPERVVFTISEECDFQVLTLVGYPGTYTRRFDSVIDRIAIERVEAEL
ncbi:MAG: hypothetical protein AAFX32_01685 [Pseudomonadota bacterium]